MTRPQMNMRLVLMSVIVALVAAGIAPADQTAGDEQLLTAYEKIPVRVRTLVEWANKGKAATPRNVDERMETLWARNNALRWIKRTIDPELLSKDNDLLKEQLDMLERDDGCDIICAQWTQRGLTFNVLQTRTIMAVAVTEGARGSDSKGLARPSVVKLADRIFRNHDKALVRRDNKEVNVVESAGGSRAILLASLADGGVQELDGGYRGECRRIESTKNHVDRAWCRFWWRYVSWWSTPDTVVFYFPKVSGGSILASYEYDEADKQWFEERTDHNKSGRRPKKRDKD